MKKLMVVLAATVTVMAGCGQETQESNASDEAVKNVQIKEANIETSGDHTLEVTTETEGEDLTYAYYVYKDNKVIEKTSYEKNDTFTYEAEEPGTYFVKVYAKDGNGDTDTQITNEAQLGEPKSSH